MSRTLHIFRKDVRHFLPEIGINLLLLVAFAWAAPLQWTQEHSLEALLPVLLRVLLPVGWFLLVSRVLHDEALVGDRQFWITRPYRRFELLAAKVLFMILFVNLPLLLMQIYLLHHAGLAIAPALGDLLQYQLAFTAIYILPFTAIGVVTAAFGQHLLALLGGLLYAIVIGMLGAWLNGHSMYPPYVNGVLTTLFATTLVAVVLAMYARRSVWPARIALFCLPSVFMLLVLCAPAKALIHHAYRSGHGAVLSFDPDPNEQQPGQGAPRVFGRDVSLHFPLRLESLPPQDAEMVAQGIQVALQAADGETWVSGYEQQQTGLSPNREFSANVYMPETRYQRLQGKPVSIAIRLPLERIGQDPARTVTVPVSGKFLSPKDGHCGVSDEGTVLYCRYALRHQPRMKVTAEVQDAPCTAPSTQSSLVNYLGNGSGLSLDFDPVVQPTSSLNRLIDHGANTAPENRAEFLCPGAAVSFVTQHGDGTEEASVTQKGVLLEPYVQRGAGGRTVFTTKTTVSNK